jgi:hypothetical protein
MSLKTKIATCTLFCALAALTVAGSSAQPALAQQGHRPLYIDIGPMSGAFNDILDSALAADRAYYGTGNPHCPWVNTSDRYGNYTGRIRTCRLPPTISNGVLHLRSERLPF